jgi:5-oxoprolinase (ATP-hydrolysing) subunit B
MAGSADDTALWRPTILPMGDNALLVRFATNLSEPANRAAIAFAARMRRDPLPGVIEIVPNLVSVMLRYDPLASDVRELAGELRLRLFGGTDASDMQIRRHKVQVLYGGEEGPDIEPVAQALGMSVADFITAHNASTLRVLATGFAPGFVYCGFHPEALHLPRRAEVRASVAVGSVLFAAGQTAITSTPIPSGWHVIGRTEFRNFDAADDPPTRLRAGDEIAFETAP